MMLKVGKYTGTVYNQGEKQKNVVLTYQIKMN